MEIQSWQPCVFDRPVKSRAVKVFFKETEVFLGFKKSKTSKVRILAF